MKPYCYPYFLKHVMEQLAAEILKEGIIRAITSQFLFRYCSFNNKMAHGDFVSTIEH